MIVCPARHTIDRLICWLKFGLSLIVQVFDDCANAGSKLRGGDIPIDELGVGVSKVFGIPSSGSGVEVAV